MNACIECGECCKWMTFIVPIPGSSYLRDSLVEFYKARGCRIEDAVGQNIAIMVPTTCPYLTKEGCIIYAKRPLLCKSYNGRDDRYMKDICKL